jgi:hypothetical protein
MRSERAVVQFLAWAAVGAGAALGVVSILTIGIFVLAATAALAVLLARRGSRRLAGAGLLTGLAIVPLYVGFLNRSGPGTVCTSTATSQSCTQEMSPWPWLAAALALAGAGAWLSLRTRSSSRRERGGYGP